MHLETDQQSLGRLARFIDPRASEASPTAIAPAPKTGAVTRPGVDWRVVIGLHLALLVAALTPLLLVDVPALVDYPNHLARMHILAELNGSPELQAIYAARWGLLPNLAMDLLVPPLAEVIGVIAAGKVFVAATLALTVAGVAALHRALYGRVGLGPLTVHLMLYNYVLCLGFLNFLFGIGLFLLLFAFWIGSDKWVWPLRLVPAALGASALFFCHLAAFATYGLCVAGYELWRWSETRPRRFRPFLAQGALAAAPFLPASLLFLAVSPTLSGEGSVHYQLLTKALIPFVPTLFYVEGLDLIILGALLLLLVLAIWSRSFHFAPPLVLPIAGLLLAALLIPSWLNGNWGNDFRLVVPLAFLVVAGSQFRLDRRTAGVCAAIGLTLFATRIATLSHEWRGYDRLFEELRSVAGRLEPGARILPAVDDWSRVAKTAPTGYRYVFYNAAALLVLERPVFVPTLFTAKNRQPLTVQAPYEAIDVPYLPPMRRDVLILGVDPENRDEIYRRRAMGELHHRLAGWPKTFDYVLMLDFGKPDNPLPDLLIDVARGSFFSLYAVAGEHPRAADRSRR